MPAVTTAPVNSDVVSDRPAVDTEVSVLVLAWSAEQPSRVGEVAILPDGETQVLGRGQGEGDQARTTFQQQRPGVLHPGAPLEGAGLSRRQLVLRASRGVVEVISVGQCPLRVNGVPCRHATLRPGDTMHLRRQLVVLHLRRPVLIPLGRHFPSRLWGEFGAADALGMLGESPATWLLREQLAFAAKSAHHALLVGASGSGKELAARAIHAMSNRALNGFVARNAATLPPALIDAELFGNAKNYPNAGMPERPGLIGQANGGTLFLDELAELPVEQQVHLLRVLDAGGEYQRLGESTTRSSNFLLVGATNRDPAVLKHDLRARLTSTIEIAPLSSRREDIPLLARHLLLNAAQQRPELAARFVDTSSEGRRHARFAPAFVEYILHQPLEMNTRELEAILWKAISDGHRDELEPPADARNQAAAAPADARNQAAAAPSDVPPESGPGEPRRVFQDAVDDFERRGIEAALAQSGGNKTRAAEILGMPLRTLMWKLKRYSEKDKS